MIVGDDSGADEVRFSNASNLDLGAFQFDSWDANADLIVVIAAAAGSTVTGSSMHDRFEGGDGIDVVSAGGGDDEFYSSPGADTLRGESGSDAFFYFANAQIAGDTIDGGVDAGGFDDSLLVNAGLFDFTGATIASAGTTSIERLSLFGAGHDVRFNGSQVGATGVAADLAIQGDNTGADIITFAAQPHLDLNGFQFFAWNEAVDRIVINGTVGTNLLRGTSAADTLNGGDSDDTLRGTLGADLMKGDAGNDTIRYTANDEIGDDAIDGGTHDLFGDTLSVDFTGQADFRNATFAAEGATSIERLVLVGADHDVFFDAGQVGGNRLAANLAITGDNAGVDFVTFFDAQTLYLSGFQFSAWDEVSGDRIFINGTTGADTITGSSARDIFFSDGVGGDVDTVFAGGGGDTIFGTAGADILRGEAGDDQFVYPGNDDIAGDTIDGGAHLGANGDRIRVNFNGVADFTAATIASTGTSSIEWLILSTGDHDVRFNAEQLGGNALAINLTIEANSVLPGQDIITFNNANDFSLVGLQFVDWNQAVDRIVVNGAGAGDFINGSMVADTIDGGGGGDTIEGGLGVDLLKGGAGNDVFLYTANDEIGAETIDGGADSDTLRVNFTGLADFRNATIASTGTTSIERLELIGDGNDARFVAEQFGGTGLATNLMIVGDAGVDRVTFDNAADLNLSGLQFTSWDDAVDLILVNGTAGEDTITGSSKRDSLLSEGEGAGIDTVFGGGGSDLIYGTAGADILRGEAGNDTFAYFNNANIAGDTIDGGANTADADTIFIIFNGIADFTAATIASTGASSIEFLVLSGGAHDVRFNASQVGATGLASDLAIQGDAAGADIITFNNGANLDLSGFFFTLSSWDEAVDRIVVNGTGAGDLITGSGVADTLNGGLGNDRLVGGLGNDLLDGGAGLDRADYSGVAAGVTVFLNGASDGFALVTGSAEQDVLRGIERLTGGAGKDALVGDGANNSLFGGGDSDFLFSTGFNPDGTLKTGAGVDSLVGEAGNDGLFAGDGNDELAGGDGDDGLVGGAGNDGLFGEAGTDFLFGGAFSPAGARLDGSGDDTLFGGFGNDGLYGFDGADIFSAGDGNDYVEGGAGADDIHGGADSDFLLGGADDDTIAGATGFDYLYGESGADTFVFRKGDSADWVLDFSATQGDKVRLLDFGFANFAAVPLIDLSSPGSPAVQLTFIESGNVDQLTIFGVTLAQLNATNVLVT